MSSVCYLFYLLIYFTYILFLHHHIAQKSSATQICSTAHTFHISSQITLEGLQVTCTQHSRTALSDTKHRTSASSVTVPTRLTIPNHTVEF